MRRPAVYVVNEPMRMGRQGRMERSIDLAPAAEFGRIVHMLPPGELSYDMREVIEPLRRHLRDYTAEDYLLLVGDPRAIAVAGALAAFYGRGSLTLLLWRKHWHRYEPVRVYDVFQILEQGEHEHDQKQQEQGRTEESSEDGEIVSTARRY